MRAVLTLAVLCLLMVFAMEACRKEARAPQATDPISKDVLQQIEALGFNNKNVSRHPEGYLVEGDVVVTEDNLHAAAQRGLRVGEEEQYRVTNLVTGLPRNISIRLNTAFPTSYVTATNTAITRFNALGLQLTFTRVATGGNIIINPAPVGATYQATAGFPSSTGNPYNNIMLNKAILDTWNVNTVATIIAHEIGHCIGFAHTDYANPAYSCGTGSPGITTVWHIPGTPTTYAVPGSWMLSCISNGINRPFVSSDVTALNYLY